MKNIVFVCVENSCRSQMAEAFAQILKSDQVTIYSAGSKPSGKVNARAIEYMQELGYDLSKHRSNSLKQIPDITYDAVITMGCGDECPFIKTNRREDWQIKDPKHEPTEVFRATRDLIEQKVKELLIELDVYNPPKT